MAEPPPVLMVELIEEVLLRFPPDDPARLVRAALVCKEWCRIVAGPGFRRRFRELHRKPPMLGVVSNIRGGAGHFVTLFLPTTPCPHDAVNYGWHTDGDHDSWLILDARHGRVLRCQLWFHGLEVSDPLTRERWEVPTMPYLNSLSFSAAVLCAAHGACDHLDCNHGFLVVLVDSDMDNIHVHVYSSEAGGWSERIHIIHPTDYVKIEIMPPALVGNALYFFINWRKCIFKYELHTQNMSVIQLPSEATVDCAVLTTVEDGELGFATLVDSRLYLWSMTGSEGDVGWAKIGVIQLQTLLPVNVAISYRYVGFAHGIGVFLVGTNEGLFSIDLKSHRVRKICSEACGDNGIQRIVPFLSFYTPDLRQYSLAAA